ncbi:catalase-like [Rhodnius prolixus]
MQLHRSWLFHVAYFFTYMINSYRANNRYGEDAAAKQLTNYFNQHKSNQYEITSSSGSPVDDITNSLTVGPRGPMLAEDTTFFDESRHFDRERIPERVVHAKGAGAFGVFQVTNDITQHTKADVFSKIGKTTQILVRFSTVSGEKGSSDLDRDVRGFAIKLYTRDGNWDLVGNDIPIFAVRDPLIFFSFTRSQKRNPVTNLKDPNMAWDFFTRRPETVHHVMRVYSDAGTPKSFRYINGFGINTFKLVNAQGNASYCKFHYLTDQGIHNFTNEEAMKIKAENPDYLTEDLYNAIAEKNYPSWTFYIQVMSLAQAEQSGFNPFDATKFWPENEYPLIKVGKFILNENPKNFFALIEQAAFAPSNLVPGIEASPDKILQGRLFSYVDTQFYRLGTNHRQLPVNYPHATKVYNTQRDGIFTYYQDDAPNYYPSSFGILKESPRGRISFFEACGVVRRYNSSDDDNFSQPGILWRSYSDNDKNNLVHNLVGILKKAENFIQERAVGLFFQVDEHFGRMVQSGLNL